MASGAFVRNLDMALREFAPIPEMALSEPGPNLEMAFARFAVRNPKMAFGESRPRNRECSGSISTVLGRAPAAEACGPDPPLPTCATGCSARHARFRYRRSVGLATESSRTRGCAGCSDATAPAWLRDAARAAGSPNRWPVRPLRGRRSQAPDNGRHQGDARIGIRLAHLACPDAGPIDLPSQVQLALGPGDQRGDRECADRDDLCHDRPLNADQRRHGWRPACVPLARAASP